MTVDLKQKWALGFNDRGHGSGDFVVLEAPTGAEKDTDLSSRLGLVVIGGDLSREMAEHLIELHNQNLERTNEIEAELRR